MAEARGVAFPEVDPASRREWAINQLEQRYGMDTSFLREHAGPQVDDPASRRPAATRATPKAVYEGTRAAFPGGMAGDQEPVLSFGQAANRGLTAGKLFFDYVAAALGRLTGFDEENTQRILTETATRYAALPQDQQLHAATDLAYERGKGSALGETAGTIMALPGAIYEQANPVKLVRNFLTEQFITSIPGFLMGAGIGAAGARVVVNKVALEAVRRAGTAEAAKGILKHGVKAEIGAAGAFGNSLAVVVQGLGTNYAGGLEKGLTPEQAREYALDRTVGEVPWNAFAGSLLGLKLGPGAIGNILGQATAQGTGGALGARSAALAVGETPNPREQALEFAGEFLGVPVEMATMGRGQRGSMDLLNTPAATPVDIPLTPGQTPVDIPAVPGQTPLDYDIGGVRGPTPMDYDITQQMQRRSTQGVVLDQPHSEENTQREETAWANNLRLGHQRDQLIAQDEQASEQRFRAAVNSARLKASAGELLSQEEAGLLREAGGQQPYTPQGGVIAPAAEPPAPAPAQRLVVPPPSRARPVQQSAPSTTGVQSQSVFTKSQLISSLVNTARKQGATSPVSKAGAPKRKWLGKILDAKDPLAAIRDTFASGMHEQAALLDAWYSDLTGQTIEGDDNAQPSPEQVEVRPLPEERKPAKASPPREDAKGEGKAGLLKGINSKLIPAKEAPAKEKPAKPELPSDDELRDAGFTESEIRNAKGIDGAKFLDMDKVTRLVRQGFAYHGGEFRKITKEDLEEQRDWVSANNERKAADAAEIKKRLAKDESANLSDILGSDWYRPNDGSYEEAAAAGLRRKYRMPEYNAARFERILSRQAPKQSLGDKIKEAVKAKAAEKKAEPQPAPEPKKPTVAEKVKAKVAEKKKDSLSEKEKRVIDDLDTAFAKGDITGDQAEKLKTAITKRYRDAVPRAVDAMNEAQIKKEQDKQTEQSQPVLAKKLRRAAAAGDITDAQFKDAMEGLRDGDSSSAESLLKGLDEAAAPVARRNEKEDTTPEEDGEVEPPKLKEEGVTAQPEKKADRPEDEAAFGGKSTKSSGTLLPEHVRASLSRGNLSAGLAFIAQNHAVPYYRALAKRLIELRLKTKVIVGPALEGATESSIAAPAQYYDHLDTIRFISKGWMSDRVLLHEAVHAATLMVWSTRGRAITETQKAAVYRLNVAFELTKQAWEKQFGKDSEKHYGLTNVHEFVAEAFTSPEFQAFLNSVKYRGSDKTIWATFVDIVRKLLGLMPNSLLEEVLDAGALTFSTTFGPRGTGGEVANWVKQPGGMWHPKTVEMLANAIEWFHGGEVRDLANLREHFAKQGDRLDQIRADDASPTFTRLEKKEALSKWAKKAVTNYLNRYAGTDRDPLKDTRVPMFGDDVRWEDITDTIIGSKPAKAYEDLKPAGARPDEEIFGLMKPDGYTPDGQSARALVQYLSHVGDYLREFVSTEQLQRYDLVRAVRETAAQDARQAKKMENARASGEGTVLYKEYPDGMKWVEVQSKEALKSEGDVMGHCVGGYCELVHAGDSKIYSLRDKKGMSHVTVEVRPNQSSAVDFHKHAGEDFQKRYPDPSKGDYYDQKWVAAVKASPEYQARPVSITQIKGKQNRAPVDKYIPYAQDFVKSGKWESVGDLRNAKLVDISSPAVMPFHEIEKLQKAFPGQRFITTDEHNDVIFGEGMTSVQGQVANFGESEAANVSIANMTKALGQSKTLLARLKSGAVKVRPAMLSSMTLRQLVDVYGNMIKGLKEYAANIHQMDAKVNDVATEADKIAVAWRDLRDADALAEVMLLATTQKIHPDKPLAEQTWLAQDKAAPQNYAALQAKYTALSPEAKKVYGEVTKFFEERWNRTRDLIFDNIKAVIEDKVDQDKEMAAARKQLGQLQGPYFPLVRFGKHLLVAYKPDDVDGTRTVEAFESAYDRDQAAQEYARQGYEVKRREAKDFNTELDIVPSKFVKKLNEAIDVKFKGNPTEAIDWKRSINQLYLQTLPDASGAKRMLRRRGVKGWSTDARRAFSSAAFHAAFYEARLEFMRPLREQIVRINDEKRSLQDSTVDQVVNQVEKRHAAAMTHIDTPLVDFMGNVNYIWYLGFTPSFFVLNLLQNPMIAMPMMASRHGYGATGRELARAATEVARVRFKTFRKNGWHSELDLKEVTSKEDEQAMLTALMKEQLIDMTQSHDLGAVAAGRSERAASFMYWATFAPHHTEVFNRVTAALAAYRLARTGKMRLSADEATQYAREVVAGAHFDYSNSNKPYFMQPAFFRPAKVVFALKQYQQHMIYSLIRNASVALKGATKEERSQARKALTGIFAMHILAAGAMGAPFAAVAFGLANVAYALAGDDDEPWDAETAFRNFLSESFGQDGGELIAKGASRLTGIDVTERIGLGDLGLLWRWQEGPEAGRAAWNEVVAGLLGPAASIPGGVFEMQKQFGMGNYRRGWEAATPKFAKDAIRASRFAAEGITTQKGKEVKGAAEFAVTDLLWQAAGFRPSSVAEVQAGRGAVEDAKQHITNRRDYLVRMMSLARAHHDKDGTDEYAEMIKAFNRKNPEVKITPATILKSLRESRRVENQVNDEGIRVEPKFKRLATYGAFANSE